MRAERWAITCGAAMDNSKAFATALFLRRLIRESVRAWCRSLASAGRASEGLSCNVSFSRFLVTEAFLDVVVDEPADRRRVHQLFVHVVRHVEIAVHAA